MTPSDFAAARHAMGLTQKQLAERLGVSTRAVQYWEAGKRRPPPPVVKLIELWLEKAR